MSRCTDLVLPGASLSNFIASDMTVHSATEHTIRTSADLQFLSDSRFTFQLPSSLLHVYFREHYIGSTQLQDASLSPGLNVMANQTLNIESHTNLSNRALLNVFFSQYLAGNDQEVILRGPVADNVLNGVLDLVIFNWHTISKFYKFSD